MNLKARLLFSFCLLSLALPAPAQNDGHVAEKWQENPLQTFRTEFEPMKEEALDHLDVCVSADPSTGCSDFEGMNALSLAAFLHSQEHLHQLATRDRLLAQGDDALSIASSLGYADTVRLLIELGDEEDLLDASELDANALFNPQQPRQLHPAYEAAERGHLDILAYFQERGFDLNGYQGLGDDLLVNALIMQRESLLDYLFSNGYDVNCDNRHPNGRNIYRMLAENSGYPKAIELINTSCPD